MDMRKINGWEIKDTPAFVEHAEKLWSVDVTLMDFFVK